MRSRETGPTLRDAVVLDGRLYRVNAEARVPIPGVWLGRQDGPIVCERFVGLSNWSLEWNPTARQWEEL